jgi:diguanylate cyclase (GGDEF)-like protein/PAS domain S-box-containing protein
MEVVSVVDPDGTLRYASPGWKRVLGYDPDEVLGTNVLDHVHPDDLPGVLEAVEKVRTRPGILGSVAEYRHRHKDGSWRRVESAGTDLLHDPDVRGVVVHTRDVTERKATEEALEESERRYATLLSNEPALVYRCLNEPDWPLVFVSDYALELTGYPPEELVAGGVSYGGLIIEEDREAVWEEVQAALAERRRFKLRYTIRRRDGAVRHVEEYGQGIYGEDDRAEAIEGLVYDVTEVVLAERRLREAEERYRTLIERIPVITYLQEPEEPNRTVYLSPQHEQILGYPREHSLEDPDHWMRTMHPEDRERVLKDDRRTNETGEPFRTEYRQFASDGRVVWLRDEATLIRDGDGRALYWLGVQVDITERKEAEEALKASEERYRSLSGDLTLLHQVSTALAHELDLPTVFCKVVEAIAETYGYTQVSAYLLEGEELVLQHQVGYERVIERIPVTEGVSGRTVRSGEPVLVEEVSADHDFLGAVEDITSEICVPLFDEGEAVGFINVESRGGVRLSQKDLRLMIALGEHVSVALSRARLHTRVKYSEEYFRSLIRNASDVITVLDADGTVRYVSPAIERMLGYRPEDRIGRSGFELLHPEDLPRARRALDGALRDRGVTRTLAVRMRHREGSWRDVEVTGTNLLGDPSVGGIVLNWRDLTERKEAEERLRLRDRAISSTSDGIIITDMKTTDNPIVYVNPAFERITGYGAGEVLGRDCRFLQRSDRDQPVLQRLRGAMREGREFRGILRNYRKDGSLFYNELHVTPVRDEDGRLVNFVGVQTDVTPRIRAEEALKESEERYRNVVERQTELVCRFTPDLILTFANDAYFRYFGGTPEEFIGKSFIGRVAPEDRDYYERRLAGLGREQPTGTVEHRVLRPGGEVRWQQWTDTAIFDAEGNVVEYQSVGRDITKRREAEESLKRSEASLAHTQRLAHLGGWEWNVETDEVSWSEEVYRIYGLAPRSVVPTFERLMGLVHPEDRELVKRAIDEALYGGKPYEVEHRVVRPDGEVRVVHRRAEVARAEGGEPLRMVGTVHDITERKVLEQRLEHRAFHDSLTDLPNRHLFVDRLKQAFKRARRAKNRGVAVLFMDLDGFKVVNDSLGHEAGDRLLVAVAGRLGGCLRPEDTLARFGGDEFVVLIEDVKGPEDAGRIAGRIVEELRAPFFLEGRELYVAASIGIALGEDRTKDPEDLLRDADTAMYRAKGEGSGYAVFDPAMYDRALRRLEVENDLRRAVGRGEFVVHYQPIFDLRTGRVWGAEALVRWNHPKLGLLNPSEFVGLAEGSGLVVPMGEEVLRSACLRAQEWHEEHPRIPPLAISVNLSARQLSRRDLVQTVERILEETGLEGSRLVLDVTETVYVKALESDTAVLDRLRGIGVRISIDDFGTGYSSLSYLKMLPADAIKIDKSFVKGLEESVEDIAIVRMVIELAHSLGMEVVAEGVETGEQARLLQEMGCDMAQGYHFSPPLPPEAAARFLAK